MNRQNMNLIGIPEEEVLAFTDARADFAIEEETEPDYSVFIKPHPDKESIDSNLDYARKLDSLPIQYSCWKKPTDSFSFPVEEPGRKRRRV